MEICCSRIVDISVHSFTHSYAGDSSCQPQGQPLAPEPRPPHRAEGERQEGKVFKCVFTCVLAHVIAKAEGLAIISVIKAGFMITARGGSGIVIARLADRRKARFSSCLVVCVLLLHIHRSDLVYDRFTVQTNTLVLVSTAACSHLMFIDSCG